jgi:hypothetical protein
MLLDDSMMASFRLNIDSMAICINDDILDPVDLITELRRLSSQHAVYVSKYHKVYSTTRLVYNNAG